MVKNVVGNIPDTYQKRLNQYSDFLTKVKSRRDKLAAAGQDVTKLDQFITTATDNLNSANTVLQTEKTTLGNLDPNQDPTQLKKTVKEQLTVVRQSLTAVNSSMSDTVQEIVAVSGGSTTPAASATQENFQRVNGGGNQQHLPPGPANRK
jgi:capsule polysaccharide export protein KpsE/RkpR